MLRKSKSTILALLALFLLPSCATNEGGAHRLSILLDGLERELNANEAALGEEAKPFVDAARVVLVQVRRGMIDGQFDVDDAFNTLYALEPSVSQALIASGRDAEEVAAILSGVRLGFLALQLALPAPD